MLIKWNPEMDEWANLLEGESRDQFLAFRSEFMKLVQQQQELFYMVGRCFAWSACVLQS